MSTRFRTRNNSNMSSVKFIFIVLVLLVVDNQAQDISALRSIRECLKSNQSILCLKERALKLIDEAMVSDKPMKVLDYVDIERNPNYVPKQTYLEDLPRDLKERNDMLNDMLVQKVEEFFESRTIKFNLAGVFEEGRAKKGGGKKGGGMMLMAGVAMAGMMAQMAMGKIAMMAGAALMMSKMALLMSSLIGLKKLVGGGGGGGGETSHVVYASGGGDHGGGGGGGGGGGWHRSLTDEDTAALAYRAYTQRHNGL